MARINLLRSDLFINGLPIRQHLASTKNLTKPSKLSPKEQKDLRGVLTRLTSDFLETQAGFRPGASAQSFRKLQQQTAAPDAFITVDSFKDVVSKDVLDSLADEFGEVPVELKQRIGKDKTALTSKTLQITQDLAVKQFGFNADRNFIDEAKKAFETPFLQSKDASPPTDVKPKNSKALGQFLSEIISAESVKKYLRTGGREIAKELQQQVIQKMQNYVVINFKDKQKTAAGGRTPGFIFFPGVVKATGIDNLDTFLNTLTFEQRRDKATVKQDGTISLKVEVKENAAFKNLVNKQAIDITSKLSQKLSANVAPNFLAFVLKRLRRAGQQKFPVEEFLSTAIGVARELDPKLADTPFDFVIRVPEFKLGTVSQNLNVKTKGRKPAADSNKFVSQAGISRMQLETLARKAFVERMPRGPRRGPPLSQNVLTFRTGRFAKSFQIQQINMKKRLISYTYDPIYYVHEATSRDPRELIGVSIRNIVARAVGVSFNVVRS